MNNDLKIYNSVTKKKETYKSINKNFVGLYVCGPTVYNQVHIGNCRTFIFFDIVYRYFLHCGYKVRYVRNITDVGHLENDGIDSNSEDKISKRAKLEQLEPMEISQKYTIAFHKILDQLNVLPPSIEPRATGHIIEQIEFIKEILSKGLAYESNGSIYFDLEKYIKTYDYGTLSNRHLEELLNNTRELSGQDEKKGPLDFALWIKAKPEHIMKWPSPWSIGFPGWHIECSAMARKYLGDTFDIHGGGLDLAATHHSNEIAQSKAITNSNPANYWLHTNMLTLNGAKMSKSLNNTILPNEIFTGNHKDLQHKYKPMVLRLLMLQAHYRSQLDISNKALEAAKKAYNKLSEALKKLQNIKTAQKSSFSVEDIENRAYKAINDDFNTAVLIAVLFDIVHKINLINNDKEFITSNDAQKLINIFKIFANDILGLNINSDSDNIANKLITIISNVRNKAKISQNWETSDYIRQQLSEIGIQLKDNKEGGSDWSYL